MAAGDKNAVLGGNPTEPIAAYEDAAADRVPASLATDEVGVPITPTNPFPVYSGTVAGQGRQTVTTPGTPVALGSSQACQYLLVQALMNNTDVVTVGITGVVGAQATRTGFGLLPGEPMMIPTTNVATVFVDAVVATEGVSFLVFT